MCGRFTQRFSWREVHDFLNLTGPALNLRPRYNVAPGQDVAAVRSGTDGRRLSMLRWGLIPAWSRKPNIGYALINARAETVASKPSFRAAYRSRRCLIPADGFYEWARQGSMKQPYLIGLKDGGPMAFAGLWEHWTVPAGIDLPRSLADSEPGDAVETCTILTTAANEVLAPIHHRMPVIVPSALFDPWLAGESVVLDPHPGEAMTLHPVSLRVNKPSNDDPRCVEPLTAS